MPQIDVLIEFLDENDESLFFTGEFKKFTIEQLIVLQDEIRKHLIERARGV